MDLKEIFIHLLLELISTLIVAYSPFFLCFITCTKYLIKEMNRYKILLKTKETTHILNLHMSCMTDCKFRKYMVFLQCVHAHVQSILKLNNNFKFFFQKLNLNLLHFCRMYFLSQNLHLNGLSAECNFICALKVPVSVKVLVQIIQ